MTLPQQPGNWSDPSWPAPQPYADPSSGAPPGGYVPYEPAPGAYGGYGGYGYGVPAPVAVAPTNGLAIASMVVSLVGVPLLVCYGVGLILTVIGAILGHVARRQIKTTGQSGDGMALAGVIIGWIGTALGVIVGTAIVVFVVWAVQNAPTYPTATYPYPS
jgi:hypothetical protein